MLSPHSPSVSARARKLGRAAAPVFVTASLVASVLAAAPPASAAPEATTGTYTIGAQPVALKQATDPELGTITPTAAAAQDGMFGSVLPFPVLPMHATLTRQGHLVSFGTPLNTAQQAGIVFDDWDIAQGGGTNAHTDVDAAHGYDSFCNAAVTLQDGRILMVSGQVSDGRDATMMSMLYDPVSKEQDMGADLAYQRWYVTALRLTDGRILLLGGAAAGDTGAFSTPDDNSKVAYTPEIGTGTGDWSDLPGAASTALFGAYDNHWWYPRAFNGPNGGVVGTSGDAIWTLDPTGNGSVQQVGTLPYDPKVSGSQVMFAPGKVLYAGGGQVNNTDEAAGLANAAVVDYNGATPQVTSTSPMNDARTWLNLTVLPTGDVFADGGTKFGTDPGDANAVRQSEIWNPTTGGWTLGATAQRERTYHSTALLLPSGAVFTGGGGNPGPVDNFDGELYYPAYLFTKNADGTVSWASRPAITAISGDATYGGTVNLTIADGRAVKSAELIPVASVTHAQSTDQRRIPLAMTQNGGTVSATLPSSVNTMPPGDYELTVVDAKGVPSTAQIITVRQGAPGLVTVGESDAGTGAAPANTAPATTTGTAPTTTTTTTGTTAGTTGKGSAGGTTTAVSTRTLTVGSSVGLAAVGRTGYRVQHSGASVSLKKVGAGSAAAARRGASWIVRTGLGSKKGYSFESVDRRGYYLVASSKGSGAMSLAKLSRSGSFAKRATFSVVKGVMGHDSSLRLTAKPGDYVRTDGKKVTTGHITESMSSMMSATFSVKAGLARK